MFVGDRVGGIYLTCAFIVAHVTDMFPSLPLSVNPFNFFRHVVHDRLRSHNDNVHKDVIGFVTPAVKGRKSSVTLAVSFKVDEVLPGDESGAEKP